MTDFTKPATRRSLIAGAAALGALPILAAGSAAQAAGTMAKANVKYQPTPNGANACGKCNYFLPGPKAGAPGLCKIVGGPISPTGWCILFAPKPH